MQGPEVLLGDGAEDGVVVNAPGGECGGAVPGWRSSLIVMSFCVGSAMIVPMSPSTGVAGSEMEDSPRDPL